MGAPVSECVSCICNCVCVPECICGERVYLRVSASTYLGVSVTAHICTRVGVRVFHVCCVYKDLYCVGVCVLRI